MEIAAGAGADSNSRGIITLIHAGTNSFDVALPSSDRGGNLSVKRGCLGYDLRPTGCVGPTSPPLKKSRRSLDQQKWTDWRREQTAVAC